MFRQREKRPHGSGVGAGTGPDCPVSAPPERLDQCRRASLLEHLPQHPLRHSGRADCGSFLPQRKRKAGSALPAPVTHGGAELRLLHSGGAVRRHRSRSGNADDPQNLRLCLDGADWVQRHEKGVKTL